MDIKNVKLGLKVQLLPGRVYESSNSDDSIGSIIEIDLKHNWAVRVQTPNTLIGNWENIKSLKQL